jgi:hypothetical protein
MDPVFTIPYPEYAVCCRIALSTRALRDQQLRGAEKVADLHALTKQRQRAQLVCIRGYVYRFCSFPGMWARRS